MKDDKLNDIFGTNDEGLDELSLANLSLSDRLSGSLTGPELPTAIPEEGTTNVGAYFKRSGLFGGADAGVPSLDKQDLERPQDSKELKGFVLDALKPAPQVLEEVKRPSTPAAQITKRKKNTGLSCPHCEAVNPAGTRFCVQCGGTMKAPNLGHPQRIAPPTGQAPPPTAAAKQPNPWEIYLISINEDGSDGVGIPLEYLETTVGRGGDTRFPTDAFLSPDHTRLFIEDGRLFIKDLHSLNGTFLKLREEIKLSAGDTFLMGRQVLRFERFEQLVSPKTKHSDGTRYMGSPSPSGKFKILQVGIGGVVQNVYCLPDSGAVLGREKGDIVFPHDKFMSSRHAQIYAGDDGASYLVDLTSSNGTWIKIWERTRLRHNDYIFLGQQLFRVHIKG